MVGKIFALMCLWCGVMRVFSAVGLIDRLRRLLSPLLRCVFPTAFARGEGDREITANIAANLLGIGNAATPLAVSAMREMQKSNPDKSRATDDMITLAVLNCSSFCIFPGTLVALRHSSGSASAASVLLPVWIASLASSVLAVLLCRICARLSRAKTKERKENDDRICGVSRSAVGDSGAVACTADIET